MAEILFLAGSAREGALSKKVAKAAQKLASEKGARTRFIDLRDYPIPLYDGDLEASEGMPENAKKLKSMFAKSDGFYIVTPEYNGFFSPLLKNLIDWMSRPDGENIGNAYQGKVAAISGSSPGAMGGVRALPHLRTLLSGIGVHVVPSQVAVGLAAEATNEDNEFINDRQKNMIDAQLDQLIQTANALKS